LIPIVDHALGAVADGLQALLVPAAVFALLAFVVKGRGALAAARRALGEGRINLSLHLLDAVLILPVLAAMIGAIGNLNRNGHLTLVGADFWRDLGVYPTLFIAIFLGDFIGYWRHRLEHSRLLWPAHAIHHSDTAMTWLTLLRFHPLNRLSTVLIDSAFLAILGLPPWALVLNALVRHYYGYFIHADLPWTYGPLGWIFVSPVMHRWHHARDLRYAGTNFATVFSVFDRAFGTLSVPGQCTVTLGIEDDPGPSVGRQLAYPFRLWVGDLFARRAGDSAGTAPGHPSTIEGDRPADGAYGTKP
jgi:sterol desaturase/sphingolipid hydroxylase (fatty acid hydroxylase superfamily)